MLEIFQLDFQNNKNISSVDEKYYLAPLIQDEVLI